MSSLTWPWHRPLDLSRGQAVEGSCWKLCCCVFFGVKAVTNNETELALLAEIGLFNVRNARFWYHYVSLIQVERTVLEKQTCGFQFDE